MSEAVALILIVTYGFSLLFTLKTHRNLLGGEPHPTEEPVWRPAKALFVLAVATVGDPVGDPEHLRQPVADVDDADAGAASLALTP